MRPRATLVLLVFRWWLVVGAVGVWFCGGCLGLWLGGCWFVGWVSSGCCWVVGLLGRRCLLLSALRMLCDSRAHDAP